MSTTERRTEEGTAIPNHATRFGTDRHGREHAYSTVTNTVYVSDGEQYHLDECPVAGLEGWIAHVTDRCGWRELRYQRGDPKRGLARRLAGGLER